MTDKQTVLVAFVHAHPIADILRDHADIVRDLPALLTFLDSGRQPDNWSEQYFNRLAIPATATDVGWLLEPGMVSRCVSDGGLFTHYDELHLLERPVRLPASSRRYGPDWRMFNADADLSAFLSEYTASSAVMFLSDADPTWVTNCAVSAGLIGRFPSLAELGVWSRQNPVIDGT